MAKLIRDPWSCAIRSLAPSRFLCALLLAVLSGAPALAWALEAVSLQLKWTHAFQFAGYYAAREKGFYREAGLEVSLVEATPGNDPVNAVIDGQAQYGVGNSSLLLLRKAGQPVVVLANIFQHSPLVLIARQHRATQGIHDLLDQPIMLEKYSDELLAYLKQEGIPLNRLKLLEHSFNTRDLIDGKVEAISAYVTQEPFDLENSGFSYQTYTPRSAGIDFYGDNLFTTESELKNHPERVKAFRQASLRGWQYAMDHPEEIIDLIVSQYPDRHPRAFYQFEAGRMVDLLRADLIEIGYMHPGRWRHIADTYAELGLLPSDFSLQGFLYQPDPESDLGWLYPALAVLAVVGAIIVYILRINRRLSRALDDSEAAHQALQVSETRHRLLADNASDVIWTTDLEGRFTYISPSVEKLRGYTVGEVMNQSAGQRLTAASIPIACDGIGRLIQAIRAGQPAPTFRAELEQPCKNGSTVWTRNLGQRDARRDRPGHRPARPFARYRRPPRDRGTAAPDGPARPADPAAQPRPVLRPPAAGAGRCAPQPDQAGGDVCRPGQVQADQRPPRPCRRRSTAAGSGIAHAGLRPPIGYRCPDRRR